MLIQEKTSLHIAGNRAIRAALELIQQRGYDHPTQTGPPDQRRQPATATADVPARWWTAGPCEDKDQRPVSRTRNEPALSNGAAGLQDPETGIGRNAGEQFETVLNLTAQHECAYRNFLAGGGSRRATNRAPHQSSTGDTSTSCLAHTIASSSFSHLNPRCRLNWPS